ncbi:MAG: hypothetical protein Kow0042_25790 [Calditrichia bacterium]
MLPIQLITKLIKILRSAASPSQIAWGFVLGMIIGFSPSFLNPINFLVIFLLIILNINLTSAIFGYAIFRAAAYFLDPIFHSLGFFLLVEAQPLKKLWVWMYNAPLLPYTRFYNTVVLGSLISSLLLIFPLFFVIKKSVTFYREKYEPRVQNWKWVKIIKATPLYKWYERLKSLGE